VSQERRSENGLSERKNDNVDIAQTTHISLCSGYGGIDLGLRMLGNGVVPATGERAFQILISELQNQN
jgi:hypothetical protein